MKSSRLSDSEQRAIVNATDFASKTLLSSSRYAAQAYAKGFVEEKSILGRKSDEVLKKLDEGLGDVFIFDGKSESNTNIGILGQCLDAFAKYDPIVVMQTFGEKLFKGVWAVGIGGVALTLATGSVIGLAAVFLLLGIACFFAYIVPITPVI